MLKALQVASFTGNLGDNANHQGSRRILAANLGPIEWTQLEIREMYWGRWKFEQDFVDLANQFDLVMIGGGGYFELWVDNSITGTTIDLSPQLLSQIKSPLVFYGLGCDIGKGAPQHNIDKFKIFLEEAFSMSNCLVSVRNDGSLGNIERLLGKRYAESVHKIPDGGFFIQPGEHWHPEAPTNGYLVINLAGDMIAQRFQREDNLHIGYEQFKLKMTEIIEHIVEGLELGVTFVPHIYKDLSMIGFIRYFTRLD